LERTNKELLNGFLGEWDLEEGRVLKISKSGAELSDEMTLENKYYEYGKYKIEARYQAGLLELDARLDEISLKPRAEVSDTAGKGITEMILSEEL